ncbi:hypothetical protein JAAARDRAFT_667496 [Jaapia argillacea MUCL 33604]|uniref:DUF221-domain-containing protein n=1 Tax=Jaapia argillacea MUCL 33604 TaxID=933084 RepID=A0A067PUP0_9AGAM|nr:hypothetical protein JAAARDRAFT_667496 [Jaapia argillacea MUCL 33604]
MSSIDQAQTASTASFLAALVFNAAVFAIEITAFSILRPHFRLIYEPRSLSPVASKRTSSLAGGIFKWPITLINSDFRDIKRVNGPDAYFFVRFLRMIVRIFLPIWLVTWVVLLPVDAIATRAGNNSGLDRFTFGNMSPSQQARYWAHLLLAWSFTIWIWFNIQHEMRHYVATRQRWLVNPDHFSSPQASTVLVTDIPNEYLSEIALRRLFSHLPGGVRKVWLNRDLKDLPGLHERRIAACTKLEVAETSLLNKATKLRNKQLKKAGKAAKRNGRDDEADVEVTRQTGGDATPPTERSIPSTSEDVERNIGLAERLVLRNKRPTHRLPARFMPFSIPLIGQKVDTIDWSRDEIVLLNEELAAGRKALRQGVASSDRSHSYFPPPPSEGSRVTTEPERTYPPVTSAFVMFNKQIAAHLTKSALLHNEPYKMGEKFVEVAPEDVIWANLGLDPYERSIRKFISWMLTIALIILWAFPVAFVGAVSNVHSLCTTYSWLAWVCKLPNAVVGIIQGILPPILLAILMMLLPIVLRMLAKFEGIPKYSGVELSLMTRYFTFQLTHSFLIVTVASGIIAALPNLVNHPAGIPSLLATHLPQASTFFLTYILLQGLSGTAAGFLQAIPLILYYFKLFLLGSTPRSVYDIKYKSSSVAWGTLYPGTTLLVVISLAYMLISPIMNGLACVIFYLFYLLYKYLFLWVFDQPSSTETGGLFFPKALQHVFVGLYVMQVCLCALFFLAEDVRGKPSSVGEGVMMAVLILLTAFFQYSMRRSYGPLIELLPLSLVERSYGSEEGGGGEIGGITLEKRSEAVSNNGKAKAQTSDTFPKRGDSTDKQSKGEIDEGFKGFDHPAAADPQRTIWLPRDILGLGVEEAEVMRERGIDVSLEGAGMDGEGRVDVESAPPDELRGLD